MIQYSSILHKFRLNKVPRADKDLCTHLWGSGLQPLGLVHTRGRRGGGAIEGGVEFAGGASDGAMGRGGVRGVPGARGVQPVSFLCRRFEFLLLRGMKRSD